MRYTSQGLRRRGDTDKWECTLTHRDPFTNELIRTFRTVEGKTKRAAERARGELIMQLELKGGAIDGGITVKQFMESFVVYKEPSGTVEPSTVRGYRCEIGWIGKYLGAERLCDLTIPMVSKWTADMSADRYAPKTVSKAFRLLKQALNFTIA